MNYLDELELFFICAVLLWNYKLQSQINKHQDTLGDLINRIKSEFNHKLDYQDIQSKSKMDELQMKCDKVFLENKLEAQSLRNKWKSIVLELNRNKMEKKLNDILIQRKEKKERQEHPTTEKRKVGRPRKEQTENFTFCDAVKKLDGKQKPIRNKNTKSLIVNEVKMALQEKYGINLQSYIKINNKEYRKEYRKLYQQFWYQLKKKEDTSTFKSKISINESEKPLF
jgi:hypothetical protein